MEEFTRRFKATPAAHQCYSPRKNRHVCLFDVYLSWYDALDEARSKLKVSQRLYRQPETTASPPPEPAFQGIYLGEEVGRAFAG
jgi:hypothetical protein